MQRAPAQRVIELIHGLPGRILDIRNEAVTRGVESRFELAANRIGLRLDRFEEREQHSIEERNGGRRGTC
jgi:hypothetical protein